MATKYNKGFTLIELLVVVAIVGLLSAVVLGQLSTARNKGKDASIKSTMNSAPSAAQLYYDIYNNGQWNGVCTANNGLNNIVTKLGEITTVYCNGTGQNGWMIYAQLKSQTGYWCMDSFGGKKFCASTPAAGYTCPVSC
ncbi:MAG: putative Type IV pilus pilin [Parcubacteria bacterium C7867-006]|nr:MAG: putative Type IV pilus pilin [Parcubacteria bacterium C7867-006]